MSAYFGHKVLDKAYSELEKWVADPFNEDLGFKRPVGVLEEFISTSEENHWGGELGSLSFLSGWYASNGVLDVLAGKSNEHLFNAFWCKYLHNLIMQLSFREEQDKKSIFSKRPNPRIDFHEQGMLLAEAFALGLITEAEEIGRNSLIGIKDGYFYGIGCTRLTPFVLRSYAKWKSISFPFDETIFVEAEAYQELLSNLSEESEKIKENIVDACEFRITRSRDLIDRENYEFSEHPYRLYPIEILMFLRIRQIMGLPNPEVDHPLLNSPLGKIQDNSYSMTPLQTKILEKIMSIFPQYA